jgi:hypothetical protein
VNRAGRRKAARRASRTTPKKSRRVVLQQPPGTDGFGSRHRATRDDKIAWTLEWKRYEARPYVERRIVRLTPSGIDWGATPGPEDEIGFAMDPYRYDDCLTAAIATATQTAVEDIPDLRLSARLKAGEDPDEISRSSWPRIDDWATKRGFVAMMHPEDEIPVPERRWIGIIEWDRQGPRPFQDHCVVMDHDRLIFDPACGAVPPPGMRALIYSPEQIAWGLSFNQKEN